MSQSGGCQCGAVRFKVEAGGLGSASICHCRMCQKATGGFFAPFVTAKNSHLTWTRGAPAHFRSSDKVRRGFCRDCGTPLTYEIMQDQTELAIGAFDDPSAIPPAHQLNVESKVLSFDSLHTLPQKGLSIGGYTSYQHPDHDTVQWPLNDKR